MSASARLAEAVVGAARTLFRRLPPAWRKRVDDRLFGAIFQATRVTNDAYGWKAPPPGGGEAPPAPPDAAAAPSPPTDPGDGPRPSRSAQGPAPIAPPPERPPRGQEAVTAVRRSPPGSS